MFVSKDSLQTRRTLNENGSQLDYYALPALDNQGVDTAKIPYSTRVLIENLLRHEDGEQITRDSILQACHISSGQSRKSMEIFFHPARVLLQDFTGVPAVVDLAAMREAFAKMGGDPDQINPALPADMVIDHSVQVDAYGSTQAFSQNIEREFSRNHERYQFLKWSQQAFKNTRVVPPGTGIVHQVNLEHLACVAFTQTDPHPMVFPDSLVGTDSHTTMINGLGVLGWGVGGIEAEAAMLGQAIGMLLPQVVGFKLKGKPREGTTATDIVLTVTQMLRAQRVVGKFVEFYGEGLQNMALPDRATIANMAPEYGATMGFFPVDQETLRYLELTGRPSDTIALVKAYYQAQGLFYSPEAPEPHFDQTLELDLAQVVPSIAGPKRPQDRIALTEAQSQWRNYLSQSSQTPEASAQLQVNDETHTLEHGKVVIAAITSCTNTSNPAVMLGAGLIAQNAINKGLKAKPWVKTSLAPGSQVVSNYLNEAGLMTALEALNFHLVGYGCTTCIGNSGPLDPPVAKAIEEGDLVVASVLSGNRNFEGRVNPLTKANYLASPPLVVAYALAGTMDIDFDTQPIGHNDKGDAVFLRDIWPSPQDIHQTLAKVIRREHFEERYADVLKGPEEWQQIEAPTGSHFSWDPQSTYVRNPPFFEGIRAEEPEAIQNIEGARVLVMVGDSVTTDHISPAGAIPKQSPAADYLRTQGIQERDFNSYGSRRGNHEVMIRGTFGNIRLRNLLAPGTEGGYTRLLPDGKVTSIYEAAQSYQKQGTPLLVLAGKEYGTGSSRDWAAKGTLLLGVRAVIAQSYERIHRSNLIGMGVLPLEFCDGQSRESLGLTGDEVFSIEGLSNALKPQQKINVQADSKRFEAVVRLDSSQEIRYYRHGGILLFVLRQLAQQHTSE